MPRKTLDPEIRFWSRVEKRGENDCWEWKGSFDKEGYGQMRNGVLRINDRAHRFSARLHFGEIPKGQCVCHKCDNPSCVNPKHLFIASPIDNHNDKMSKNRHVKGELQGHSKLTEQQVAEIRNRMNESYRTLCNEYNLAPSTVYRIWHGQAWKHSIARAR